MSTELLGSPMVGSKVYMYTAYKILSLCPAKLCLPETNY